MAIEFWMISRALNWQASLPKQLARTLRLSYLGDLDPAQPTTKADKARDAQFEIWLGSWFAMAGRPVQALEPDLRVSFWFEWYGVAAKRVRSRSKIVERVKYAAGQVQKHTKQGFVAISLDNYAGRRGRAAFGVKAGDSFFAAFPELSEAEEWLANSAPWVKGLLVYGHLASWRPRGKRLPLLEMSNLTKVTFLNMDATEEARMYELFEELASTFRSRWPTSRS